MKSKLSKEVQKIRQKQQLITGLKAVNSALLFFSISVSFVCLITIFPQNTILAMEGIYEREDIQLQAQSNSSIRLKFCNRTSSRIQVTYSYAVNPNTTNPGRRSQTVTISPQQCNGPYNADYRELNISGRDYSTRRVLSQVGKQLGNRLYEYSFN